MLCIWWWRSSCKWYAFSIEMSWVMALIFAVHCRLVVLQEMCHTHRLHYYLDQVSPSQSYCIAIAYLQCSAVCRTSEVSVKKILRKRKTSWFFRCYFWVQFWYPTQVLWPTLLGDWWCSGMETKWITQILLISVGMKW